MYKGGAFLMGRKVLLKILISVGDPDLENPHVFGPPASASGSLGADPDPSLFLIKVLSSLK
jgi:hypothetical protein